MTRARDKQISEYITYIIHYIHNTFPFRFRQDLSNTQTTNNQIRTKLSVSLVLNFLGNRCVVRDQRLLPLPDHVRCTNQR